MVVIGEAEGLFFVADLDDRKDRSEGLVAVDLHVGADAGEQGGGVEITGSIEALAAAEQARSVGDGGADVAIDDPELALEDHRADVGVVLGGALPELIELALD